MVVTRRRCLRQCRAEGLDREATLFRLATTVEGVYVPQFYDAPGGCEREKVAHIVHGWLAGPAGWAGQPAVCPRWRQLRAQAAACIADLPPIRG